VDLRKLLEDDDVGEAVEELRLEGALGLVHDAVLKLLRSRGWNPRPRRSRPRLLALQHVGPDVRGQDDDHVPEVDDAAEQSVRRPSSRACSRSWMTSGWAFSISSKSTTRVRLAADRLGELAAFVVADVAREASR
jgi:hypothetical protein